MINKNFLKRIEEKRKKEDEIIMKSKLFLDLVQNDRIKKSLSRQTYKIKDECLICVSEKEYPYSYTGFYLTRAFIIIYNIKFGDREPKIFPCKSHSGGLNSLKNWTINWVRAMRKIAKTKEEINYYSQNLLPSIEKLEKKLKICSKENPNGTWISSRGVEIKLLGSCELKIKIPPQHLFYYKNKECKYCGKKIELIKDNKCHYCQKQFSDLLFTTCCSRWICSDCQENTWEENGLEILLCKKCLEENI